jgi:hypothetical protein
MRTSSQFRQKLERILNITFSAHRHDEAVGAAGVRRC